MALIEVENIDVFYDGFQALKGMTCAIEGGSVGLLGPNGSGKTTLMKTLLGFNRAKAGAVRLFGMSMPGRALEARQRLGYMPEREVVSPKVSAVAFLTYVGQLFGMTRIDAMERTHEVLNYVGVGESRYRKMDTYSTGMLQRVKLAQALIHDPELLLLDEPTNGLDPDGRLEMLELIKEVGAKREVCIVLSSHLLPDVQHVCERVIMVRDGEVVRDGSMEELTAPRDNCYEVRVRDNKESFLEGLDAAGFGCRENEKGILLVSLPGDAGPKALFRLAREKQTQIRHFQPARSSLAEAFMEAMTAGNGTGAQ